MAIRIEAFGGLKGAQHGAEIRWMDTHPQRAALLLYLAIEGEASRDTLLALLWRDVDTETAAHRLSQLVYSLRQALGDGVIETRGRQLRPTRELWVDAVAFAQAVESGRLSEAVTLYRGPFLSGVHLIETHAFQEWVEARRTALARAFRKACRELTNQLAEAGELSEALSVAHAWVAQDNTDDEAQHRLIELLGRVGDRSAALEQYGRYERLLRAEGLEPLDDTKRLARELEQARIGLLESADEDAVQPPPSPDAPAPRDEAPRRRASTIVPRKLRTPHLYVGAGIALVLALTFARALPWRDADESGVGTAALPRVAILPLHVVDVEGASRAVGMGITMALHGALGGVKGLHIVPMHAVLRVRQLDADLDSLARVLGADWLVGGVVSQVGSTLQVTLEVLEPSTSRLIATRSLAGEPGKELALIEEVVDGTTVSLRELLGRELRLMRWHVGSSSREAVLAMANAFTAVGNADRLSESGALPAAFGQLREAEEALSSAVRSDPDWTEPHIELARLARRLAFFHYGVAGPRGLDSLGAIIDKGLEHANEALRLAPGAARGLEARGELWYAAWQLLGRHDPTHRQRAELDLDAALSTDTSLARAGYVRAALHFLDGEIEAARLLLERAYRHDALLDGGRELLTRLYTYNFESGRDDEAARWCRHFDRQYGPEWFSSYCRLELMVWDSSLVAAIDSAWALAERGRRATPLELRAAQGAQLMMLVAGVLARANLGDSARRVVDAARATQRADSAGAREPFASSIDRAEADVRIQLRDFGSAAALLQQVVRASPLSAEVLRRGRRMRAIPPEYGGMARR